VEGQIRRARTHVSVAAAFAVAEFQPCLYDHSSDFHTPCESTIPVKVPFLKVPFFLSVLQPKERNTGRVEDVKKKNVKSVCVKRLPPTSIN
jgi:hypothetical protein